MSLSEPLEDPLEDASKDSAPDSSAELGGVLPGELLDETSGSSPIHSAPEPIVHHFPLEWVIGNAAPPTQYRAIHEVAALGGPDANLVLLPLSFSPGLRIAVEQGADGVWHRRMLFVPDEPGGAGAGIGTIPAVHRLRELGLPTDFPALMVARRPLFRLLAEDNDPHYLYELAPTSRGSEGRARGRLVLREASAAALAHMGYEDDPRLRGCANRMMQRVRDFLASPLAADPWVRVGNKWVISPEASPPSVSFLVMLARLPHYRHEHYSFLEQLREYLSRAPQNHEAAVQVSGDIVAAPELVTGDPLAGRDAGDRDLAMRLFWLEVFARLGWLDRQPQWQQQFDRLLGACDQKRVWHPGRGRGPETPTVAPAWAAWRLDAGGDRDALAADVTTRLGIIARAAGREVELV